MDMYDDLQTSYEVPVKKRKKKLIGLWIALGVVLALAVMLIVALPTIRSTYAYTSAVMLFEMEEYEQAAEKFAQLPGQEEMVKQCHYWQGEKEHRNGNYEEAVEFFTLAADYENADEWLEISIYDLGHEYFLEGEYDRAQECFDRLEGQLPEGTAIHFAEFADAVDYLKQQSDVLSEEMICYVGQMPREYENDDDALWEMVSNIVPFRQGTVDYVQEEQYLYVSATYYPGNKIIYAWRSGDESGLTQEEKEVMELALSLVEQARAESQTQFEIQLWLYNWLCEHIQYDNPDMDVPDDEYLKLRQLTCVGALLDSKANCQGYTDAFYLLGTLAGFDVCRIGGESEEPHSWNGIMLDGKLYFVDATFGDMEDENGQAMLYTWFNCSYDPDWYTIDGGTELFPQLVMENDLSQGYYTYQNCVFETVDEAALYLLRQYKEKGEGWSYAVVPDSQITSEELFEAIDDNMSKANVWSVSWTEVIETYGGNTYFALCWE